MLNTQTRVGMGENVTCKEVRFPLPWLV